MRMLVDEAAFEGHPHVREAALRRAVKEWGITEVASFNGSDLGPWAYAHVEGIRILTSPEHDNSIRSNLDRWIVENFFHTPREKSASKMKTKAAQALLGNGVREALLTYSPTFTPVGGIATDGGNYWIAGPEDIERIDRALQTLTSDVIGLDFETTGDYPWMEPDGFSLSWADHQAVYIPMKHTHPDIPNVCRGAALGLLEEVVYHHEWVAHNAKFEMHVLHNLGLNPRRIRPPHDTLSLARHTNEDRRDLKSLAGRYLHHDRPDSYKDLTRKVPFSTLPPGVVREYACSDADDTRRLLPLLQEMVTPEQEYVYECIERRLIPVLGDMERQGLPFDRAGLEDWHIQLLAQVEEYKRDFFTLIGVREEAIPIARESVNLSSPADVNHILFNHLGLEPQAFSARGYKTDQRTIDILKSSHPAVEMLQEIRAVEKLDGTYAQGLLSHIARSPMGRVHPNWNAGGTSTGRMSSDHPNGQNMPPECRQFLVAPPGYLLVGADYSQIELRAAAALSGEERYLEAFRRGRSPHLETMRAVFGKEDRSDKRRYTLSKNINFAVLNSGGPDRLVEQALEGGTRTSREETQRWLTTNQKLYPRLWTYREEFVQEARRKGYAETVQGKRTYIPNLKSSDPDLRAEAERQAFSVHIQGTCGLFAQEVMCEWDVPFSRWLSRILLNVHDEIVLICDDQYAGIVKGELMDLMKSVAQPYLPNVPIEVEGAVGHTWAELK